MTVMPARAAPDKSLQLDVSILGRDYKVAYRESERAELMQAVALLDARKREIRDAGKVAAIDRIAVMASLTRCCVRGARTGPRGPRRLTTPGRSVESRRCTP